MHPTFDDVCDQIEEWEVALPPERYVARLLQWAGELAPGAVGRAELLVSAGEVLLRTDPAAALPHLEEAARDGGRSTLDARVELVNALLRLDREAEADRLVKDLRSSLPPAAEPGSEAVSALAHQLGEVLELHGRFRDAQRWFTIGLRDFRPEEDDPDDDERFCLGGRYRVRRYLDLATDAFDTWMDEHDAYAATAIRERRERARAGLPEPALEL